MRNKTLGVEVNECVNVRGNGRSFIVRRFCVLGVGLDILLCEVAVTLLSNDFAERRGCSSSMDMPNEGPNSEASGFRVYLLERKGLNAGTNGSRFAEEDAAR